MSDRKTYTIVLSRSEIDLVGGSLRQTRDWLQDQKGQLTGCLIGFSKIDEVDASIVSLSERLLALVEGRPSQACRVDAG